jgi:hypothetical protein
MRCANGHRDNRWPPHAFATAPAELLRRVSATDDRSALIAAAAIPHDRLGVPRTAREIAVLPPLARQTALPKRLHDVNHEPNALRPNAQAPRPHDFRAFAAPVHHATARLDPLSPTGGVSNASASRAAARGRSAAATRTTMPSAARHTVPSGPSRSNAKSRTPCGLGNSPFARFIAFSFLSQLLDGRRKKTKARRRLSLGCRALALKEEAQYALSVFPLGERPARNGQRAILVPREFARHRDATGECRPTPRCSLLAVGHLHHRLLLLRHAPRGIMPTHAKRFARHLRAEAAEPGRCDRPTVSALPPGGMSSGRGTYVVLITPARTGACCQNPSLRALPRASAHGAVCPVRIGRIGGMRFMSWKRDCTRSNG